MKLNVIRLFNRQHEICVHMHWSMQQQVIVQGWYSGTITSWLYFRFQLMQLPKAIPACLPGGYPDIATLVVGHYVKSDGNGANGRTTREGSTMPPPWFSFLLANLATQCKLKAVSYREIVPECESGSCTVGQNNCTKYKMNTSKKRTRRERKWGTAENTERGGKMGNFVQSRLHWLAWHCILAGC